MQSSILLCLAAFVACTYAQMYVQEEPMDWYPGYQKLVSRHPRDLTWSRGVGNGRVFGTLGSTDDSVFGRGGYKQDIFNDHRGHLQGQAYGSRVLSPYGDSSNLGGRLDWSNPNAKAGLDVHKQIGGGSGMKLSGDGVWNFDKNTRLSAGGNLDKTFGHHKPQIGVQAEFQHDF
nr:gloverin [Helicoverpa armigera]